MLVEDVPNEYTASNTFIAWIARQVPELGLELPFNATSSGYKN